MDKVKDLPQTLKEWAFHYATMGWWVLPCLPGQKEPNGLLVPHGVKDATRKVTVINEWWKVAPNSNVAINPAISHLHVVDIDVANGKKGMETWEALTAKHGTVETLTQTTGSGGKQLFFSVVAGLPGRKLGKGIDTRGIGGYVVVPGSLHPCGNYYQWDNWGTPIAPLPNWIREILEKKPTPAPAPAGVVTDIEAKGFLSPTVLEMLNTDGNSFADRSEADYSVVCALVRRGLGESDILGIFARYPIGRGKFAERGEKYLLDTIAAARGSIPAGEITPYLPYDEYIKKNGNGYVNGNGHLAKPAVPPTTPPEPEKKDEGESSQFNLKNPKTKDFLKALAHLEYSFRLNLLDNTIECNGEPMTDALEATIRNKVRDLGFTSMVWLRDAWVQAAYEKQYHPVKEFFNQLVWDGKDYISLLFSTYFTEVTGFGVVALKRWLVGAVAKCFDQKQNFMLVIDGPQGRGKSFFAKWLCPMDTEKYFNEAPINPESKDQKIRTINTLLWEVAELQATTRKSDREALKSFLTMSTITERRPYDRYDTVKPALCSFIGTINEDGAGFLRDSTGNRRFVIINIQEINQKYSEEVDKNQLWAQAVALYKAGEPWQLTPEETAKQREIQADYEGQSVVASFMWDYYEIDRGSEQYTLQTEVVTTIQNCGIKMNDGVLAEINRVITSAGGKKIRPRVGNSRPVAYQCLLRLAKPTSIEPLKTAKEIANEIPI